MLIIDKDYKTGSVQANVSYQPLLNRPFAFPNVNEGRFARVRGRVFFGRGTFPLSDLRPTSLHTSFHSNYASNLSHGH